MRKRFVIQFVCFAAIALVTLPAIAQPGGGRGGRGGGGGRPGGGGPGGPGGFGGGTSTLLPLSTALRIAEVRDELEIMPDQEEALRKLGERQGGRDGGGERPNFREMSEEERRDFFAKMQKEREERTKEAHAMLEQILLPPQLDRLHEISIQIAGTRALFTTYVIDQLEISKKQQEEMKEVSDGAQDKMRAAMQEIFSGRGRGGEDGERRRPEGGDGERRRPEGGDGERRRPEGGGGFDRDAIRAKFEELRKGIEEEMMAVLTSSQRKQFEELKGEKFEMPEGASRFGGRGGRGGEGGGRGGRGGDAGGRGGRGGERGGEGGDRPRRPRPEAEE